MFQSLDRIILDLADQGELWFQPNPGNAGDSLIAAATWRRFRALGVHARQVPASEFDPAGKIVLYGGGGNLIPLYSRHHQGERFVEAHHAKARKFVVLPHTIDGNEELLASLGGNCIVFCREEVSYRHCLDAAPRASVELSHDLALGLDPLTLPAPGIRALATFFLRALLVTSGRGRIRGTGWVEASRLLKARRRLPPVRRRLGRMLDAFRTDAEGLSRGPEGNIDISADFAVRCTTEASAEMSASMLLDSLRGWNGVRTDRLHVCIASALLGLDVEFFPNSYFKCEAVWKHSLRDRFPSVRWMGG